MIKPIKFLKNILREVLSSHEAHLTSVPNILLKESIEKSAEFAKNNMSEAMMFFDHRSIWTYTISRLNLNQSSGHYMEFGVFQGTSINFFAKHIPHTTFYGFDSFEGLQEDWKGWSLVKGAFDLKGKLPKVEPNVKLIKGWFDKTIPSFIQSNKIEKINFLHVDCDTYEATVTIFENLGNEIQSGTLILFDEYFGYRGWEIGEHKAFKAFIDKHQLTYKYLAFAKCQVLVEIL